MNIYRRISILFLFIVLSLSINNRLIAQDDLVAKYEARTHTFNNFTVVYRLYVPENYDPTQSYPAVLVLHGNGRQGNDNISHLNKKIAPWAADNIQSQYPSFIIAPQAPMGYGWTMEDVRNTVFNIIDSLFAEFSINQKKLYVSGGSMGGRGSWDIPLYNPYLFAASVPISGTGTPEAASVISHVPFWVIHGTVDDVVPVERSRVMIEALEELGRTTIYTHCNYNIDDCSGMDSIQIQQAIGNGADLFYSEYENERHGIGDIHFSDPNVFQWLYQQEKSETWLEAEGIAGNLASVTVDHDTLIANQPTSVKVEVSLNTPLTNTNHLSGIDLDISMISSEGESFIPLQMITPTLYSVDYTLNTSQSGLSDIFILLKSDSGKRYPLSMAPLMSKAGRDMIVEDDTLAINWSLNTAYATENSESSLFVKSGNYSHAMLLTGDFFGEGQVSFNYNNQKANDLLGFSHLQFFIHGGDTSGQDFNIVSNMIENGSITLSEMDIVPKKNEWQLVRIPIEGDNIEDFSFKGLTRNVTVPTFYIDDIRLVTQNSNATGIKNKGFKRPLTPSLGQNYPNPFNPSTNIQYTLTTSSDVKVLIYNILGQKVNTLVNRFENTGAHSVKWDGTNDTGSNLASGIYIYKINAGNYQLHKKMILMR
jgi:dienelactone hydrolase